MAIDEHLPDGGLALGALHEVAGGGNGAIDGAASLFAAEIAVLSPKRGEVKAVARCDYQVSETFRHLTLPGRSISSGAAAAKAPNW
jgi:protein ImuA